MSLASFVEAEVWTIAQTDQGNVVLIRPRGSSLAVPIFIGQMETQSILIGMGKVDVPRPLTHDTALAILRSLGGRLVRIEINDLKDGTFFSRLVIEREDREIHVDTRPSDAVALAVRQGCPVFIAEFIVDEAGISVNLVSDGLGKASGVESVDLSSDKERLRRELEKAVDEEDYERAAILRDKLKDLET